MNVSSRLAVWALIGAFALALGGCGAAVRPDCQVVMWDAADTPPEEGAPIPAETEPLIVPEDVDWSMSQVDRGDFGQPVLMLALTPAGTARMAEFTRSNVGSYMGIALNGTVVVVPLINSAIEGGLIQIESSTNDEAFFAPFASCVGG